MANLTITVDAETLRRARIRALQRNESVNAYLADVLRRYADEGDQARVFEALDRVAGEERVGFEAGGRSWQREDLYRV